MSILLKPHLTEKSMRDTALNRYTFLVRPSATKTQIRTAVESLFGVNVVKVTTQSHPSRRVRSGRTGRYQTAKGYKKAVIELKPKQTIKYFETK